MVSKNNAGTCVENISMLTLEVTSTSKQMFFPLVQCFDFKVIERSMFDPLTYDTGYLNAVIFGAQAYKGH